MTPLTRFLIKNGMPISEAEKIALGGKVQRITAPLENQVSNLTSTMKKIENYENESDARKIKWDLQKKIIELYEKIKARSPEDYL